MTDDICRKCKWWVPALDEVRLGCCKKNAPVLLFQIGDSSYEPRAEWPETADEDFCGQFEAKPG